MFINLLKLTILFSRIWNQSLKPGLNCQVSTWETQIWVKWRIPGMGEPGGLPSMGSHRVGHDWSDLVAVSSSSSDEERGEAWAGMFPYESGFLWNQGDSIPWRNQMEGTFVHPFSATLSSLLMEVPFPSSLTAHCLSPLGFVVWSLGSVAAQETNAVPWSSHTEQVGCCQSQRKRRVFEGNWEGWQGLCFLHV